MRGSSSRLSFCHSSRVGLTRSLFPSSSSSKAWARCEKSSSRTGVDVLDLDGRLVQTLGRGQMAAARDLAVGRQRQELFVADAPTHNVKVFSFDGTLRRVIGSFGLNENGLNFPTGVFLDEGSDELHIADHGNHRVQVFSAEGSFVRSYGEYGSLLGQFQFPRSVVVRGDGQSLVADPVSGFVTRFTTAGVAVERFQPTLSDGRPLSPNYLNLAPGGLLLISGTPAFVAT